jgi:hypothetical protein
MFLEECLNSIFMVDESVSCYQRPQLTKVVHVIRPFSFTVDVCYVMYHSTVMRNSHI